MLVVCIMLIHKCESDTKPYDVPVNYAILHLFLHMESVSILCVLSHGMQVFLVKFMKYLSYVIIIVIYLL